MIYTISPPVLNSSITAASPILIPLIVLPSTMPSMGIRYCASHQGLTPITSSRAQAITLMLQTEMINQVWRNMPCMNIEAAEVIGTIQSLTTSI